MSRLKVLTLSLLVASSMPALAQNPPSSQSLKSPSSCGDAQKTAAATQPAKGNGDGTAPGNAGSTGWTGGLGGSYIGTTSGGATPDSKSFQPETARGLDPMKSVAKTANC